MCWRKRQTFIPFEKPVITTLNQIQDRLTFITEHSLHHFFVNNFFRFKEMGQTNGTKPYRTCSEDTQTKRVNMQ